MTFVNVADTEWKEPVSFMEYYSEILNAQECTISFRVEGTCSFQETSEAEHWE